MPDQDDWKETFQNKFVAHITSKPGNIEHDRAVIFFEDIVKIEALIEKTLSSQAHALKERILKKVKIIPAINPDNSNDLLIDREQTLSAIESIEI